MVWGWEERGNDDRVRPVGNVEGAEMVRIKARVGIESQNEGGERVDGEREGMGVGGGEGGEEGDTSSPDIGGMGRGRGRGGEHLWSSIKRRPCILHYPPMSPIILLITLIIGRLGGRRSGRIDGKTKVGQNKTDGAQSDAVRVGEVDEDVFGLDVAVGDRERVDVGHGVQEMGIQSAGYVFGGNRERDGRRWIVDEILEGEIGHGRHDAEIKRRGSVIDECR